MPKILVAYYSRTGHTRKLAEALTQALSADIDPILETVFRRGGFLGNLVTTWEALGKRESAIRPSILDPGAYDLVAIGTQVWAGNLPPPVRAYVSRHRGRINRFALFCTLGGMGSERVFAEIARLIGRQPVARLEVRQSQLPTGAFRPALAAFASACQTAG